MPVPFVKRWEVSSFLADLGSFVETARVKPVGRELPGQYWVQRLVPVLAPVHRARVLRRWYLASRLTSVAWPQLIDAGDDEGRPWVVVEASGYRLDGTVPFADPLQALREVRKLAQGLAEAEGLLEAHLSRSALALRPNVVSRNHDGGLTLHLAALDQEPDEGFPAGNALALFTPEELLGHPSTARTNVFCLGWLLWLTLTGQSPYSLEAPLDLPLEALREQLRPQILAGRLRALALPEAVQGVEPLLRRALAPQPQARLASAAAFAEALLPLAPGLGGRRHPGATASLPAPPWFVGDELLPADLEAALAQRPPDAEEWEGLAARLDAAHGGTSSRAALIRRQPAPVRASPGGPGLVPALEGERLDLTWHRGYVRRLEVSPAVARADTEAQLAAVTGLLQHPSLRFVREVRLAGPAAHARVWVDALQRQPLPALRQVAVDAVAETDPWALDLAYRLPRWTWTFGGGTGRGGLGGLLKRLLGP
jgi:hypothetical protein